MENKLLRVRKAEVAPITKELEDIAFSCKSCRGGILGVDLMEDAGLLVHEVNNIVRIPESHNVSGVI